MVKLTFLQEYLEKALRVLGDSSEELISLLAVDQPHPTRRYKMIGERRNQRVLVLLGTENNPLHRSLWISAHSVDQVIQSERTAPAPLGLDAVKHLGELYRRNDINRYPIEIIHAVAQTAAKITQFVKERQASPIFITLTTHSQSRYPGMFGTLVLSFPLIVVFCDTDSLDNRHLNK